jgi:hypothetical protein
VKVGDGRGFIMETTDGDRIVITAAHCLPSLPVPHSLGTLEDRTYCGLIGALNALWMPQNGVTPGWIWAEVLFADSVADIAVLGSPDNQELADEAESYDNFAEERAALPLGWTLQLDPPWSASLEASQVLSLKGEWLDCRVSTGPRLILYEVKTEGGMSGSPILVAGAAVGVVVTGSEGDGDEWGAGPQPRLSEALPAGLLRRLKA